MTHNLIREGHAVEVEASPIADSWHFWDLWAGGTWEADVLAAISSELPEGGLLFDIGAWIGPIALWAAVARSAHVIALEPDPAAFQQLEANIALNDLGGLIEAYAAALNPSYGRVNLMRAVRQGDSTSSTTRMTLAGDTIEVAALAIGDLLAAHGRPDLVKIDIEGAESIVLPAAGPVLRELGIPVLLSVHAPGWFAEDSAEAFNAEFARWRQAAAYDHETYLLRP